MGEPVTTVRTVEKYVVQFQRFNADGEYWFDSHGASDTLDHARRCKKLQDSYRVRDALQGNSRVSFGSRIVKRVTTIKETVMPVDEGDRP